MAKELLLLSPYALVTFAGLMFLALEVFATGKDRRYMGGLAAAIFGIGFGLTAYLWTQSGGASLTTPFLAKVLTTDRFALFLQGVMLLAAASTALFSVSYLKEHDADRGEYYSTLAFATLGMMVMVGSRDLITLFIGLEVMSLAVYLLVAFKRVSSYASVEAALKYFILGSVAGGVFLFGIAFLYGLTGSTDLPSIQAFFLANPAVATGATAKLVLVLFVATLGFKIAAVPFHFWTPDAYQGAPTPITGFMATGVKVASFGILLRVFLHVFQADAFYAAKGNWMTLFYGLAIVTMVVGNVTGVVQSNVKRMLAWSSVAHAGYILVGVITITVAGDAFGSAAPAKMVASSVLFYLLVYTLANLVAFGVLSLLTGETDGEPSFDRLNGLAKRHPVLAAVFALSLLSLAGIPPTGGFFGKFFVFREALRADTQLFLPLVVVAVLASVVSVYYYLRPIVHMYMKDAPEPASGADVHRFAPATLTLAFLAAMILFVGVFPGSFVAVAERATAEVLIPGAVPTAAVVSSAPAKASPPEPTRATLRPAAAKGAPALSPARLNTRPMRRFRDGSPAKRSR